MAATKVGVGEDEYITMCSELKSMQDNFLQQIENVKEWWILFGTDFPQC